MRRVLRAGPLMWMVVVGAPGQSWSQATGTETTAPSGSTAPGTTGSTPATSGQTQPGVAPAESGLDGGPAAAPEQSAPTTANPASATGAPVQNPAMTADPSTTVSPVQSPSRAGTEPAPTYGTRRKLTLLEPPPYANPKLYTLSLTGGNAWLKEGSIYNESLPETSYGPNVRTFRLQVGRQFFDQIQVQLDVGFMNETAYNASEDGTEVSGDETTLKVAPFAIGAAYRLDYFDEQPVVPYVTLGGAGAIASLKDANKDTATAEVFHRLGGYLGGGLEILLDTFEPARAADLELSSGINDTFIVVDLRYYWLKHYIDFDGGSLTSDSAAGSATEWSFSGFQLTAGLKFDF